MTDENVLNGLRQAEAYLSKPGKKADRKSLPREQAKLGEKAWIMEELKTLRSRLGMSQRDFASRFGFSLANIRNWEQEGRGIPDASSRLLIEMIKADPSSVEDLVRKATHGSSTNSKSVDDPHLPRLQPRQNADSKNVRTHEHQRSHDYLLCL